MLICVPNVLSKDDVADFRRIMDECSWEDGRSTAGAQSALVKSNEQLPPDSEIARKLGVKTDTLVGVCAERSLEMVIGLLGILKAGGAYLPLDPEYPQERLAFMLSDTGAPLVVTASSLASRLPPARPQRRALNRRSP